MKLQSPEVIIDKTTEDTFNFLSDVKNFEKLMPDNISKFEVINEDTFLFALKGMPEIKLTKKQAIPNDKVVLGAAGGKLDFYLTGYITKKEENKSLVKLEFEGDFNPMMAMMIKGPIGKFIETLVTNMTSEV